jgi:copper chaperone CopZ
MEQFTLALSGMTCGHCVSRVRSALSALDGVQVDQVAMNSVTVSVDTDRTSLAKIIETLDDAGYPVQSTKAAA